MVGIVGGGLAAFRRGDETPSRFVWPGCLFVPAATGTQVPAGSSREASSGVCLSLRAELGEMLLHKAQRQVRVSVAIITALSCDQHASNSLELNGPGQQPHALKLTDGRAGCGLHRGGQPPYIPRPVPVPTPGPVGPTAVVIEASGVPRRDVSTAQQGLSAARRPTSARAWSPARRHSSPQQPWRLESRTPPCTGTAAAARVTSRFSSYGGCLLHTFEVPVCCPSVRCCVSLPRFLGLQARYLGTAAGTVAAAGWVPASQPAKPASLPGSKTCATVGCSI